jgi:hypothetical protein
MNNIRHETSRHFSNKKRKYPKDKIDESATKSKNKNTIETCTEVYMNLRGVANSEANW